MQFGQYFVFAIILTLSLFILQEIPCITHIIHNIYCIVNIVKSFGENLKRERKLCGLTQTELALKMGITQQQLSQWECNKFEPTVSNIVALAKALDVSYEDLFEGVGKEP